MKFNIGDRVRVKRIDQIPEERRDHSVEKVSGKHGIVVDKIDVSKNDSVYFVKLDGCRSVSTITYSGEMLERTGNKKVDHVEKQSYSCSVEVLDNLVSVRMLKDDSVIGTGYGHILHEGDFGVAQACAYAMKKIMEGLDDGSFYAKNLKAN